MLNMQLYNKSVVCVMATNHRTVRQHNYSYCHRNIKPFQSGKTQKTDSHIRKDKQKRDEQDDIYSNPWWRASVISVVGYVLAWFLKYICKTISSILFTYFVSKRNVNNYKIRKIEDGARSCPRNIAFINCINSNALKT
jgi:hypothetical protein